MVHVLISKTKTRTSEFSSHHIFGTSIQSTSLYVQPQLYQLEYYKHFYTTLEQLSPRYHWEGVLSDQIIQYNTSCPPTYVFKSHQVELPVQDSLYSKRFFFPKFPHHFFFKVLNLSKSTQWTCLTSFSSASPRVQNKSINNPMNFQNLPSQSACLLPTVCDRHMYLLSHCKTSSGDSHINLTRSKVWFALSRSRAWCASF